MAIRLGASDQFEFDSAGIEGYHVGEPPDRRAIARGRLRGYALAPLRARRVTSHDFEQFDLSLAMDREHFDALERRCPPAKAASTRLIRRIRTSSTCTASTATSRARSIRPLRVALSGGARCPGPASDKADYVGGKPLIRTIDHNLSMEKMVASKIKEFHVKDRNCPLSYEPSGQDFLSPWLAGCLPQIPKTATTNWLPIGVVIDKSEGKLAHLDGLNLSRAWMLEGIAAGLPSTDVRRKALLAAAKTHADSGLAAVTGEHSEGGHWLGSFATYLVTARGIGK